MKYYKNKRWTYGLKSKTTGKIIEKFRLLNTLTAMKSHYEELHGESLEVVKL